MDGININKTCGSKDVAFSKLFISFQSRLLLNLRDPNKSPDQDYFFQSIYVKRVSLELLICLDSICKYTKIMMFRKVHESEVFISCNICAAVIIL